MSPRGRISPLSGPILTNDLDQVFGGQVSLASRFLPWREKWFLRRWRLRLCWCVFSSCFLERGKLLNWFRRSQLTRTSFFFNRIKVGTGCRCSDRCVYRLFLMCLASLCFASFFQSAVTSLEFHRRTTGAQFISSNHYRFLRHVSYRCSSVCQRKFL